MAVTIGTHVGNLLGGEIPGDEILFGSEVGESSDRLDINAWCSVRDKRGDASVNASRGKRSKHSGAAARAGCDD